MTVPKSFNSNPRESPRIACYGTAFLADAPVDAKLLMRGIGAEAPQFGSPRLDASFLINCARFLTGGSAAAMPTAPSAYVSRVAGTDFHSPKATVFYGCSSELRGLLASLTAERAAEMATEWYSMFGKPKITQEQANGRTQRRLAILKNLAALAVQGKDRQTLLILRVDYRKQRSLCKEN
jgi:hypothetical protein